MAGGSGEPGIASNQSSAQLFGERDIGRVVGG